MFELSWSRALAGGRGRRLLILLKPKFGFWGGASVMHSLPARVLLKATELGVVEFNKPHPEVSELVRALAWELQALWEKEGFLSLGQKFWASRCEFGVPPVEVDRWRKALQFVLSAECCPPDFVAYAFRSAVGFLKSLGGMFLSDPMFSSQRAKHIRAAYTVVSRVLVDALGSPALGEDALAEASPVLSGEDVVFWRSVATLFPAEPVHARLRLWTAMMSAALGNPMAAPVLEHWTNADFLQRAISCVSGCEVAGGSVVELLQPQESYICDLLLGIFVAVAGNTVAPPHVLERAYAVARALGRNGVRGRDGVHRAKCARIVRALVANPATPALILDKIYGLEGVDGGIKEELLAHPNLPRRRIERVIKLILAGKLRRNAKELVKALASNPAVTTEDLAPLCLLDEHGVAEATREGIRRRLGSAS